MKKHKDCHQMSNFYAVETAVLAVSLECNTNIQETKHIYNWGFCDSWNSNMANFVRLPSASDLYNFSQSFGCE